MSLEEKINSDLNQALKSGDGEATAVLRLVKTSVINLEKAGKIVNDELVLAALKREIRERKESLEHFSKAGRQDLVEKENRATAILKQYLPEPLDENKLMLPP